MEFSSDLDNEPHKIVEVKAPHSRPLWQKILFFAVLLVIAMLLIFGVSSLINKKDTTTSKKETAQESKKEATKSAKVSTDRCTPKQDLNNTKQGYQACFETGWEEKEIKVSGLEVGLSNKGFSGDFPGIINVEITDKSEDLVTQNQSNNSSKFEFGKITVGNVKGTQLVITRQKDDPMISYPRAIITAVTKNNRTYIFTLNSNDADFEADTKIYEDFLGTVEFLKNAEDPPWSDSRNIIVDEPWPNSSITSPVAIFGQALSFEGVVGVRIKDGNGTTLTETTLKTASGTERSAFSGSVSFDKPKTGEGTIEVYNTSAKDGSDQDKVTIKIKFQ